MTKQNTDPRSHDKPCTICHTPRSVLVRCTIDETGKWHFVCPGKCWRSVSGGEIDAKGHEEEHPYYRYGGMWKNRHEDGPLNAKKPKKKQKKISRNGQAENEAKLSTDEHLDSNSDEEHDLEEKTELGEATRHGTEPGQTMIEDTASPGK